MGKCTVAGGNPGMKAPSTGIPLRQLAEGSIINIPENGVSVPYYIVKHDYESGLNGTGRTLLARKYCEESWKYQWSTSGSITVYSKSNVDSVLSNDLIRRYSQDVRTAMESTKIHVTDFANNNFVLTTIQRSLFLLSATEYGFTDSNSNGWYVEGASVPINLKQLNNASGNYRYHWTRTITKDGNSAIYLGMSGSTIYPSRGNGSSSNHVRPCFTLPSDATFIQDDGTLKFKGVP